VSYPLAVDVAFIARRLDAYERLVRLDKPIGALLLLWPTLWAVWLAAGGRPHLGIVLVFILGTLLMRSAGCAINDYADREFDPHVERTRRRPLAAGEITPREALMVAVVLAALAFPAATPFLSALRGPLPGLPSCDPPPRASACGAGCSRA